MQREKDRRAKRRELTLRLALRRRLRHIHRAHPDYLLDPSPENVDCVCEIAPYYFAKQSGGCRCSKKKKRSPKYGRGCCYRYEGARQTVHSRVRAKKLMHALARGWIDREAFPSPRGFCGM